ncbi:phosphotransferase family protein [Phycicoccus sp. Soil748]|uniref:phosphotransferase family protein n=1 Tax=Phycicoccus sp. Soil748 TaxID=1736397 RepID=UPI000A44206A|nr:aminoglycoside phosphotransferase family protein [Phycicoccus sp. Soil748]
MLAVHPTQPAPSHLDEVLSGARGEEPVRRLVLDPWRHGFADALGDVTPGRPSGRLEVLRSTFKPGRRLSAYYLLGTDRGPIHVAATWRPTTADGHDGPPVSVLVSPADPAMPQLARLADADHLARAVAEVGGPLHEPRRDGLRLHTIRYRPGERHVLGLTSVGGRPGVVVKTDRDHSGERAVVVARAAGALLRFRCPRVGAAVPLGWVPSDAASLWALAPGSLLSRGLARRSPESTAQVSLLGQALRLLHDDTATAEHLQACGALLSSPDVAAEVAATRRAAQHVSVLLPAVGQLVDALLSAVATALTSAPPGTPTLVHGDLKADNVLTGDVLRVLDLDRAGLGDPAADLAKLVADLHWWCPGRLGGAAGLLTAFRDGYGPGAEDRWSRAAALVPLYQLRFAARRCVLHERDWSARVEAQVASAAASAGTVPW